MKIFLNLLPPARKAILRRRFRTVAIIRYGATILLVPVVAMGALMGFLGAAQIERQGLITAHDAMINTVDYTALMHDDHTIVAINDAVGRSNRLLDSQRSLSRPIVALSATAPDYVRLATLTIDAAGLLTVTGVARTRDDVLAFRDALVADTCFVEVDLPITSIVRPEDAPFSIVATVTDHCL